MSGGESITSRANIERQARAAAKTYDNVNDACPYPFATEAGQLFKAEFARARAGLTNTTNTEQATQ